MSWRRLASVRWVVAAALLLAASGPAFGAGFGIFEQGSKAMGMAGAFTAQADDPSLLFHNAGGLAFVDNDEIAAGATWIKGQKADFTGAAPFPGPGARGEQELLSEFPPHLYYVAPINQTWKWGIGVNAPFGLVTEWKNPNTFPGRFLSTKASLQAFDVNPTIGWQISPNFGLGFGAIGRFSKVELNRNIGAINPFTQTAVDVGKVKIESDGFDSGYGWNFGLLHKVTPRISWGLSYRSKISIDYSGDGRLTQISTGNAQLDAIIRARTPFDTKLPVKTGIDFPDMASVGVAVGITPRLLVEVDANWTGWSSFEEVVIKGDDPTASAVFGPNATPAQSRGTVIPEGWDDAMNYRLGVRLDSGPTTQWRFGYVYDETPQPEEVVSPLLPDANRNGFTAGYGSTGPGLKWDVSVMYLKFDQRERHRSLPNEPTFNGTYDTTAWLFGLTIGWK
ncbi:MAG TPA: outer membrane protein transport protein [Thermoanaerobaculia bacterium]|jgi:long-chain fatty acid transport protein|nr:outer membrane protein transport protein [Thermoanaerobaculia bacterium]